jgi:hypothetical protein
MATAGRASRSTDGQSADLERALETGPFDRALQLAIKASDLKLATIERRLGESGFPVARSTLSYWQQGRRQPERPESLEALTALEAILRLEPGVLRKLVGQPKPRGRWVGYRRGGVEWSEVWEDTDALERVLDAGQRRENNKLENIMITESFAIGPHRHKLWHEFRQLVRAREDGADRHIVLHRTNPGIDVRQVGVEAIENCRVGRRRYVPENGLAAFELLLDRGLRAGQTHLYAFRQTFPEPSTGTGSMVTPVPASDEMMSGRVFRDRVHSFVMQGRFDPSMLPVRCFWVRYVRVGGAEQTMEELPLSPQHTVHFSLEGALPSAQAIKWEWE